MKWTAENLALVAAVATAAATVTSAVLTALWRWLDRKEADWGVTQAGSSWVINDEYGNNTDPAAWAFLANVGEGTAYRVEVAGHGCQVDVRPADDGPRYVRWAPAVLPVVRPGDFLRLTISAPVPGWESAEVVVTWSAPPTRRKRRWLGMRSARRRVRLPLEEIAPAPQLDDRAGR